MKKIYYTIIIVGCSMASCKNSFRTFTHKEIPTADDAQRIVVDTMNMYLLSVCEQAQIIELGKSNVFEEVPLRTYCNCTNREVDANGQAYNRVEETFLYVDNLNTAGEEATGMAIYFMTYRNFYFTKRDKGYALRLQECNNSRYYLDLGAVREVMLGTYQKKGQNLTFEFRRPDDKSSFRLKAEVKEGKIILKKITHPKLDEFSNKPQDEYIDMSKVIQFVGDSGGVTFHRLPAGRDIVATELDTTNHHNKNAHWVKEFLIYNSAADNGKAALLVKTKCTMDKPLYFQKRIGVLSNKK